MDEAKKAVLGRGWEMGPTGGKDLSWSAAVLWIEALERGASAVQRRVLLLRHCLEGGRGFIFRRE